MQLSTFKMGHDLICHLLAKTFTVNRRSPPTQYKDTKGDT